MDSVLMWVIQGLMGIVVAFGLNILKNVNQQIKDVEMEVVKLSERIDRHKDTLNQVELPNVGIKMCNQIQETHQERHVQVDKSIEFFDHQCGVLADKAERNREAIIRFDGKLDQILYEVKELQKRACT